jgi:hypothetical protein
MFMGPANLKPCCLKPEQLPIGYSRYSVTGGCALVAQLLFLQIIETTLHQGRVGAKRSALTFQGQEIKSTGKVTIEIP